MSLVPALQDEKGISADEGRDTEGPRITPYVYRIRVRLKQQTVASTNVVEWDGPEHVG